jgi:phosphomannomutase
MDVDFAENLAAVFAAHFSRTPLTAAFAKFVAQKQFWEIAKLVGAFYNQPGNESFRDGANAVIKIVREYQGLRALTLKTPTTVIFGTSGWRGVIGEDFTLLNVQKVTRGIVEMMKSAAFLTANRYRDFTEVQKHGIVVLRDNRYLGTEFCQAATQELGAAGIKVFAAGMCPTGVGSAVVTELHAAGSLNFTPSHNPMDYAGLKFNPADGGPAGPELTTLIEKEAQRLMLDATFVPAVTAATAPVIPVAAPEIFTNFLGHSQVFDLQKIRAWLNEKKHELALIVDFMHGAARGYIEAVLGVETLAALRGAAAIEFLHADDDFSFHGVKPEPSAANQQPLGEKLRAQKRPFTLAVALDPDADRIRFADAELDVDMNIFGAIAYANLLPRHLLASGGIASTAPSSDFALEIAKREQQPVYEFAVGFKNFREVLTAHQVLIAFEESDGITCYGHTLEKCAVAGFLLALDTMMRTGKNLAQQYRALREKYGWFYPAKAGADVRGVSVTAWEEYKKKVIAVLQHRLYKIGDQITIGGHAKEIVAINIIDGLKVIFADRSWILLRPSGTEPKFRYYYELAAETAVADSDTRLREYCEAAAAILAAAREIVEREA